ncbi:MAG: ABC transporter ATP-binding protein [Acetatifactor sp.]|nr:ABC transporter ATP-binding protein [Acetatifactor sp.]
MIELDRVCFAYDGQIALRYVSLCVCKRECVALMGDNGCGKSTLLKLVNGLIFPEEGRFFFHGREITEETLKDSRFSKWFHQKMGFVFQNSDIQLFCGSVWEEIAFGPRQMGLSEEEVVVRVEDVISLLKLEKLRDRAPYHLSGGEKRKTALACILSMNPEVLVLDEPLAGLDRRTREWLTDFLMELKEAGKTLLISTHDEEFARRLADRLVIMSEEHEIL